jgi:hypothetical protein
MPRLVVNTQIQGLSPPDQFFAYASSYLSGAILVNEKLASDTETMTWADRSVVLLLAAHAVELFLKGAILSKDQNAAVDGHDIDRLLAEYRTRCAGPDFGLEIPFTSPTSIFSMEEIADMKKRQDPPAFCFAIQYERKAIHTTVYMDLNRWDFEQI